MSDGYKIYASQECVDNKTLPIGGEGYPWEWVNPPMIIGVEYRTVERYEAKE